MDVARLNSSLDQLARDPALSGYAQAEQARARDAIGRLAQARSRDRAQALYIAERRVDLAKATAQLQEAQLKVNQLDREHDQIQLDGTRREVEAARRELDRQRMPVIAVAPNGPLLDKLKSNLQEVRARGGELLVFADGAASMDGNAARGSILRIDGGGDFIAPAVFTVPMQLLAYHVAVLRGTDVDQPRNLAKSVTVE